MLRELKNAFSANILLQTPLDSRNAMKNLNSLEKGAASSLGMKQPVMPKSRNNQEQALGKIAKAVGSYDKGKQNPLAKLTKTQ